MAVRKLPDQAYLRECFDYDPESGSLLWRERPIHHFRNELGWLAFNGRWNGTSAGTIATRGYLVVFIEYKRCYAHRVIFKWMTGMDPEYIDHKNGNPIDNRWDNLREATRSQNAANSRQKRGARFPKGVRRNTGGWQAKIRTKGKDIIIGQFGTPEEAHAAWCKAAKEMFGEFFNSG